MKLKYFLRGLGIGIIFGALIMLAGYMTSGSYKMSDEEIIKEAEKLGMVKEERPVVVSSDSDASTRATTENTTKATTEAMKTTTEATTTEATTTEATTTEATTEATTENKTTDSRTDESSDIVVADIEVKSGMNSTSVAKLLQDAGIIEDYRDFDRYLDNNGYSKKIQVRKFTFSSNMTYEEIAKELVRETP